MEGAEHPLLLSVLALDPSVGPSQSFLIAKTELPFVLVKGSVHQCFDEIINDIHQAAQEEICGTKKVEYVLKI